MNKKNSQLQILSNTCRCIDIVIVDNATLNCSLILACPRLVLSRKDAADIAN